jgi:hypothetical protein
VGAAVISGVNATPVLEFSEHVFDFVALSVQHRIMRNRDLSVGPRRNAGGDLAIGKGVSKPVSVIPLVCKQCFREPQTAGPVLLRRDVLLAGGSLFAVTANTATPYIAEYADLQNAPVVCL